MSSTFTDGVAVTSGFLVLPSTWSLEANHRYLKGTVLEIVPAGDEGKGITQHDLDAAENFSWRTIVTRLVGWYNPSDWSSRPPHPLYEIWDLMASAYVVALVGQRKNIEDVAAIDTQKDWMNQAIDMLRNIVNPEFEGDRINLINTDGTVQHKRSRVSVPKVVSTSGVVFFPHSKESQTAWGNSIRGSVEEFIQTHCRITS